MKRNARLNCIAHLLSSIPYGVLDAPALELPPRQSDEGYVRPTARRLTYVPDYAATLTRH